MKLVHKKQCFVIQSSNGQAVEVHSADLDYFFIN